MFLSNMFQEMFTGVDGDGPIGGSGALKVWRSFAIDQYAKNFAKAGGIGIAPMVYDTLLKEQGLQSVMSPITTAAEAEQAIDDLTALIEKLTGLVEQETALIHAGQHPQRVRARADQGGARRPAVRLRRALEGEREIRCGKPRRRAAPRWRACRKHSAPCCKRT